MAEEWVLVCALASEPDCVVAGSITGHYCSQCGAEMMVAPSGQRMLREHPGILILCAPCAIPRLSEFDTIEPAPGADEELAEDLNTRQARHERN